MQNLGQALRESEECLIRTLSNVKYQENEAKERVIIDEVDPE